MRVRLMASASPRGRSAVTMNLFVRGTDVQFRVDAEGFAGFDSDRDRQIAETDIGDRDFVVACGDIGKPEGALGIGGNGEAGGVELDFRTLQDGPGAIYHAPGQGAVSALRMHARSDKQSDGNNQENPENSR